MSRYLRLVCCLVILHEVVPHKVKHETHHTNKSEEEVIITDHRFFLNEIFSKYGSDGIMTFEGFEHLLENLGLGRLSFEKNHNVSVHHVNGTFLEVHDKLALHRHDHHNDTTPPEPRDKRALDDEREDGDYEPVLEQPVLDHAEDAPEARAVHPIPWRRRCLSPQVILATYGLAPHHDVAISPVSFLHLCPAIVYELDQRSCNAQQEDDVHLYTEGQSRPSKRSAWQYASLSVLAISLTGLLGVAVVPLVQKAFFQKVLHFLVAVAVGSLCGDALLHLLPHALQASGDQDHTVPVLRAATAFGAMAFFFVLEAVVRAIRVTNDHSGDDTLKGGERSTGDHVVELGPMLSRTDTQHTHQHHHQLPTGGGVSSIAWMVIFGDGLHNLTDGLAIGAAFSGNIVAGFATTLAVFCHELPHELGDFAVLLKSGMSVKRALFYNIVSSILSFIGMIVGVWVGDHEETALWIYAATAGIFLYIGLSDLIPEMSNMDGSSSLCDTINQLGGIMVGGGIMLAIALYETDIESIFN